MSLSRNPLETAPQPRRREVLAWGASLALLPSLSWAARPGREGLAIGYCPELADGGWLASLVTPAERLAAGEANLARGARLTVHGLIGEGEGLAGLGLRSAELAVGFPAAVECRAWGHRLLPVENEGTPVRFTVPVEGGLRLALELEGSLGHERRETVLSVGREPGAPKLRAGHYLIALDPALPSPLLALSVDPA